jgi:imidazolonepropionase-like amidohydrolase
MQHRASTSLACLITISLPLAVPPEANAQAPASRGALASGAYAITNVAVVPMTSETVIRDGTVIVRDGRIAAIGPSRDVRVPSDLRRIDGAGKYLIPGLADMHVHLYSDGETPDSVAHYELGVMLANGVTTARFMIGTPEHLTLRGDVAAGRVLGPKLWVASPQFAGKEEENGVVVATPEQARAAVRQVVEAGYDFVKLTTDISLAVYDAVTQEAKRRGIRVIGHVDTRVGVPRALAAGQQIEHLDGYFESVMADSAPPDLSISNYGIFKPRNWETLDYIDDAKVDQIATATARAGVWSTPTLHLFNTAFGTGESDQAMRSRGDWSMITPEVRRLYLGARVKYWKQAASEARRMRYVEVRNALTRKIAAAGGKIMAGSDTPEWLMAYGWALHREIEAFVEAGLTPYQALQTATTNPAEFLKANDDWGTIQKGKRADLVLVAGNPLENIRNTTRIEAVVVGGRWLPRAELDRMIAIATDRLDAAPPDSLSAMKAEKS